MPSWGGGGGGGIGNRNEVTSVWREREESLGLKHTDAVVASLVGVMQCSSVQRVKLVLDRERSHSPDIVNGVYGNLNAVKEE